MGMPLWFSNLVLWSVQVALLVLAAGFLARALKLQQPRVLLTYWRLLVAVSLLLPLLQPWHRAPTIAATVISADFAVSLLPPSSPAPAHWHLPSLQSLAPILGIVILAGIFLRLAILGIGVLKLRRIRQASQPVDSSTESGRILQAVRVLLAAPAEFRFSADVGSPVTFGFFSPVVLLPKRFASLDPRFQSAIACHELLHVRRRDWGHHLGEEVLRALFWFHPAIAWLISRVRLAREQVVDLEVVHLTNARKSYLEALLEFTNARTGLAAIPAPPFLAERQLVERVSLMLKEVRMSQRRLIVSLALISSCLALVIALAAWTFPLKATPRTVGSALRNISQQNADAIALQFDRIEVKHHDFGSADLNDAVVNAEQARLNELPGRLTADATYDQTKADAMGKALQDFWGERGVTIEVRFTLAPSSRSTHHIVLQFDVYKQTVLPGKLEGGVSGGVARGISGGVAQGISDDVAGGVPNGIAGGISGGVSGGISTRASAEEPSVDYSTVWLDTVKRGAMPLQVRGMGTLVHGKGSANLVARVTAPASMSADVKPGENATVGSKNGPIGKGHVSSVGPVSNDTRTVDIALDAVPKGAAAGLEIMANIEIGKLDNVLYFGRPVNTTANGETRLFKIVNNGAEAVRTTVKLGRASANNIEVLDGLQEGDKVILSDMSSVANADRIHMTHH
jgi:beta-lactamase regulating signal transducer with metallopeptidase domain